MADTNVWTKFHGNTNKVGWKQLRQFIMKHLLKINIMHLKLPHIFTPHTSWKDSVHSKWGYNFNQFKLHHRHWKHHCPSQILKSDRDTLTGCMLHRLSKHSPSQLCNLITTIAHVDVTRHHSSNETISLYHLKASLLVHTDGCRTH